MLARSAALAALALASFAGAAHAHSPYLRPSNFAPSRDWVTVSGGMHEETALVADFALRPGEMWETQPDGSMVKLGDVVQLKGLTVLDAPLPRPGTYRISTGLRPGREMTWAQVDGQWRALRPPRPPGGEGRPPQGARAEGPARRGGDEGPPMLEVAPEGARTIKSVGYLRADTYVTRGAPSDGAWKPTGDGLEFAPAANPNDIYLDKPFGVRLLLDGKPVGGAPVLVRRGDDGYAERKVEITVTTDKDGRALVRFPTAGAYVLEAKSPPQPAGAAPAARTYAVSLTVEANP